MAIPGFGRMSVVIDYKVEGMPMVVPKNGNILEVH